MRLVALIAIVIAFYTGLPAAAESALYPDAVQIELSRNFETELFNDHYAAADSVADLLIAHVPQDPSGYILAAVGLVTHMYDAESDLYPDRLDRLLDTAEVLATRGASTSNLRRRAWMFLWLGHSHAYRALWEARFGSGIAAAGNGRKAAQMYERGLDADSTVYDLYFGLGLYHYWKSAKGGVLSWIGLISDDKEKGVQELELAADSALLSREAARSSLILVCLDRGDYNRAISLAQEMHEKYPDGWSFLWPLAFAYYDSKQWQKAADVFEELGSRLIETPGNYYNVIICDYFLSVCYRTLGSDQQVRSVAERVRGYSAEIPEATREEHQDMLESFREIAPWSYSADEDL